MDYEEARQILIQYNRWRRNKDIPNSVEMPKPKDIGKAIEVAIDAIEVAIEASGK